MAEGHFACNDIYIMLSAIYFSPTAVLPQFSVLNYVAVERDEVIQIQIIMHTTIESDLQLTVQSMNLMEVYDGFEVNNTPLPNNTTLPADFPQLPPFLPDRSYLADGKIRCKRIIIIGRHQCFFYHPYRS